MQNSTWSRWSLFSIIGFAYFLRISMMPIMGQNDVLFMPWMTQFLSTDNPNIYANLHEQYGETILSHPAVWAPYPYGFYLFTALWSQIVEIISGVDFQTWQSTWSIEKPARLVFFFKLIYLPFDLLIFALLYNKISHLSGILWAWSPVAIYTPFMMGQNDIYATFCTLAATWAISHSCMRLANPPKTDTTELTKPNERWLWAGMILLGIGATFKIFPLLILPPLLLVLPLDWSDRIRHGLISISIFLLSVIPFLSTPSFLEGVLFNPEGSQLFRSVNLLGIQTPLFIFLYGALVLGLLLVRIQEGNSLAKIPRRQEQLTPWLISTLVFALLFLLVPTPSYWLIWITPFLAVVAHRSKLVFVAWVLIQGSFALTLPSLHSELGIALPTHLVDGINIPNFPTIIQIMYPSAHTLYSSIMTALDAMMFVGLLGTIGATVYTCWIQPHVNTVSALSWLASRAQGIGTINNNNTKIRWTILICIALPTILLYLGLGLNLYAGRNLVSRDRWQDWQPFALGTELELRQEISSPSSPIHGAWVKVIDAPRREVLETCFFNDGISQATSPIRCAQSTTANRISNGKLYFHLSDPLYITSKELSIRIHSKERSQSSVLFEAVESSHFGAIILENQITQGHANLSLLTQFEPKRVMRTLIIENVIEDTQLLIWFSSVLISVLALVVVIVVSANQLHLPKP